MKHMPGFKTALKHTIRISVST